jgi:3-oxoadipate enol-lactonase
MRVPPSLSKTEARAVIVIKLYVRVFSRRREEGETAMSFRFSTAISLFALQVAMGANADIQSGYMYVEGGGQLYYETIGSGEPVVLIHGNAGDRRHWDQQFKSLGENFFVIRYDARGYGKSSLPTHDISYSDHEDLAMLLNHLEVRQAHIVGWSFGSGIAFDYATVFPDRTLSVISIGPWVNGYSSPLVQAYIDAATQLSTELSEEGPKVGVDAWMRLIFPTTIRDPFAGEEFAKIAADYSWWAFMNASQARPLIPSAAERLGDIEVPTLIVTAEYDLAVCQEAGRFLQGSIKGAELIVMADTGHLMAIEKPAEFNRHLSAFLMAVGR